MMSGGAEIPPANGPWDAAAEAADPPPPAAAPQASAATKAVNCPNCGGSVEMRAAGYSVSVACQYCGSILDVATPEVALIERYNEQVGDLPLPLGSRGWVKGHEYQIVGYVERATEDESWDEFLLFNPYYGYRWLVRDSEGWSFGTMLTSLPQTSGASAQYAAMQFYNEDGESWDASVSRVVGEFYWRVQRGDVARLTNFYSGDYSLSCEESAGEVNWTVSEPIGRGEMRGFARSDAPGGQLGLSQDPAADAAMAEATGTSAFADGAAPAKSGWMTGDLPGPFARAWTLVKIGGIAAGLMILIMIALAGRGMSEQKFPYQLQLDGPEKTVRFGPLRFDSSSQRVVIRTEAPGLDNAWIDTDVTLVERSSQRTIAAYGVVEHYSGSDSDGPWTEGSDSGSVKLASVPAGEYDLVVDASAHSWPAPNGWGGQTIMVETGISSGGIFFSNFILALFLLMIPPVFLIWRGFKGGK